MDEDNVDHIVCKAADASGEDIYFQAPVIEDEMLLMKGVIKYAIDMFTRMAMTQKDFENVRTH